MGVLDGLEPGSVFHYFEEICGIPHASGNAERISDYLAAFARERGLFCIQDSLKNIIIVKNAFPGYEDEEPFIIQGHMDMVAVKKPDCPADMGREPLRLKVKDGYVYAEGTSLGGDDGIAVAYALALLDADDIPHPRLEVVITTEEEVGMDGARGIDLSMLKGRRMINLDSEDEGIFLAGCAGGARVYCHLPVSWTKRRGRSYRVTLGGLAGGHSGAEIHKGRGNANCLMGRLWSELMRETGACLCSFEGGLADNAIPREAEAVFVLPDSGEETAFRAVVERVERELVLELEDKDPGIRATIGEEGEGEFDCLNIEDARKLSSLLMLAPDGVQAMSGAMEGLVETSLNLGIAKLSAEELTLQFAVRSSLKSAKDQLILRLSLLAGLVGGSVEVSGDYPGWAYRADSALRNRLVGIFRRMYGREPEIQAIHAGLECGIFVDKIPGLDCVSLGPNMKDIHTTEEKLDIASVRRVWEFLLEVLGEKE